MKKYLSFFRVKFSTQLQYRAAAYAGVVTQFAWGIMTILMYQAFYLSNPESISMNFDELIDYIWLRQAFLALFMTWGWDKDILSAISDGTIAYELIRPLDVYSMWFTKILSGRYARTMLRCAPILVIAFFLPAGIGLSPPADFMSFMLFVMSTILGSLVTVSLLMFLYIISLYTISSNGFRIIFISVADFLSGGIIPIPIMPDNVQRIVELLPFASMENVPLRIYSGNLSGMEAMYSILLQVFWLAAALIGGKLLMKHAMHRVVVQGG